MCKKMKKLSTKKKNKPAFSREKHVKLYSNTMSTYVLLKPTYVTHSLQQNCCTDPNSQKKSKSAKHYMLKYTVKTKLIVSFDAASPVRFPFSIYGATGHKN